MTHNYDLHDKIIECDKLKEKLVIATEALEIITKCAANSPGFWDIAYNLSSAIEKAREALEKIERKEAKQLKN